MECDGKARNARISAELARRQSLRQRLLAAVRAILFRSSAESDSARARPPFNPPCDQGRRRRGLCWDRLGEGALCHQRRRGDIDHAFGPLVQIARAFGGLRHIHRPLVQLAIGLNYAGSNLWPLPLF
jgi:hypothetical protein